MTTSQRVSVTSEPPPPAEARKGFRPDLDGLRAVAVLAVVAFHVGIPGFDGGFIGVDVFFVISGYLITRLLLDEERRTRSIAVGRFWLRRIRRLVPALGVVIVATLLASLVVYSPLEWKGLAKEGAASALYVSNILFARDSTKYFEAAGVANSPFLHTWSLGVEEQFYLVWPLLVLATLATARRLRLHLGASLLVVLGAVAALSFALSYQLSESGTPWAFFSLPTRAWEFAVAGIVGVLAAAIVRVPRLVRLVGAWAGLGLIVVAVVTFDGLMPYPGVAALVPVAGTALVLAASTPTDVVGPGGFLATSPMQWLGRLSYGWYLWHWPLIVLAAAEFPEIGVPGKTIAAVVALFLAVATHHLVENPIRFRPAFVTSWKRTLAAGAAFTLVALGTAGVVAWSANRRLDDPLLARLAAARAGHAVLGDDCPGVITVADVEVCTYGDPQADTTVLFVGDSHAAHWLPAFDAASKTLGVRVLARTYGGCPAFDARIALLGTDHEGSQCPQFRDDTARVLDSPEIDAVVVSNASYGDRMLAAPGKFVADDDEEAEWRASALRFVNEMKERALPLGIVLDNPYITTDPIECSAKEHTLSACDESRRAALAPVARFRRATDDARRSAGWGVTLDPTGFLCGRKTCHIERDGRIAYSDSSHLSDDFVVAQAPSVASFLQDVLAQRGRADG